MLGVEWNSKHYQLLSQLMSQASQSQQAHQLKFQSVEMKAVTWQKDSHGLFDYETQLLTVKKYRIAEDSSVYRQDQEINIFGVQAPAEANQQFLTTVLQDSENSNFYIQPDQSRNESADNYLIVRSLKNSQGVQKGYKLEPGDVIKLGRMEYSIIEMRDQQGVVRTPYNEDFNKEVEHGPIAHDSSATCRICLNEGQTEENPFITPCKCRGTCEFVHFNCLKYWIDSRAQQKQQNGATTYKWKKLDCEICETPYPPKVKVNDHSFHLAEIVRPETPYLIMQSSVKDKKASKGVFVIQCPEVEAVKLGRGHQCDIRISDISVSRLHALIKYEDGNFVIVDNNSKFGTLVKMMKPFQIIQDKVAIQVGRTVLTFVMKQDRQEKVK